jgi:hypothetical protein
VNLSWQEIAYLANHPQALQLLCDYHDHLQCHAESVGLTDAAKTHQDRQADLKVEIALIRLSHNKGEDHPQTHAAALPIASCPVGTLVLLYGGRLTPDEKPRTWRTGIYQPALYEVLGNPDLAPTHWMERPPNPV